MVEYTWMTIADTVLLHPTRPEIDMNRRSFALGTAALFATGGVAGGWQAHRAGLALRDPSPFAPWTAWEASTPGDPAGLAVAAILASNPHNTQPWRFVLDMSALTIHADPARHLGAFDPFRRELWIGLGAAVANAEVAAPGLGFRTAAPVLADLGLEGQGRIILGLERAALSADPLAAVIAARRTNRAPYAAQALDPGLLERVVALAGPVPGARLVLLDRHSDRAAAFAAGTVEATRAIVADEIMSRDGHAWFRADAREVARHCDGVSVPTAGLSPFIATLGQLLPTPDAQASGRYWLDSTQAQLAGAAGFGLIIVDDLDARHGQVAAGRLWQRLHLALTAAGLAGQPISQVPELVDRDRQLGRDRGWRARLASIAGGEGHATFAFRFGRPLRQVPRSARRGLDQVLA
jgi:hypothetical protein